MLLDDDTLINLMTHNILNPKIVNAKHLNEHDVYTLINPRFKGNNLLITYS